MVTLSVVSRFPFLNDIETQIRFLIALPILIAAELIIHIRLRPVVRSFVTGTSSLQKKCHNSTRQLSRRYSGAIPSG